jgi:hypothetical protein
MCLQHRGGEALYRELLQAATPTAILFGFRKSTGCDAPSHNFQSKIFKRADYGLHMPPPQPVPPVLPPSAFTMVGVTKVLMKITAVATASSTRFTVLSF